MSRSAAQSELIDRTVAALAAFVSIALAVLFYNAGSAPAVAGRGGPTSLGSAADLPTTDDPFTPAGEDVQDVAPPSAPPPPMPATSPPQPAELLAVQQVSQSVAPLPSPPAPATASTAVSALTELGERPQIPVENLSQEQVRQECEQYKALLHKGEVRLKVDYQLLRSDDVPAIATEYVVTSANSRVRVSPLWQVTPVEAGALDHLLIGDLNRSHWPQPLASAIQQRLGTSVRVSVCFVLNDRTALAIYRALAAKGSCLRPGLECEVRLMRQGENLRAEVIRPQTM